MSKFSSETLPLFFSDGSNKIWYYFFMSEGEYDGNPNQDPDLALVPKARHRSKGEGRLPRVMQDPPQIPGMEYYEPGELEAQNIAEGKGPNGTGIVSNKHLEAEDLDQFIPPDDLSKQGIEVNSDQTSDQYLKEQILEIQQHRKAALESQMAAQVESQMATQVEPQQRTPDVPFLDKVRGQARIHTGELDITRANELMRLKHLEQRVLGDDKFMPAEEYDRQRQRQLKAEIEANRLNKLRPVVQDEPQEEPGILRRVISRLRGNK